MKIADDPARAPHRLVYLRNLPEDADPWDEKNWFHSNPALGDFLYLFPRPQCSLEKVVHVPRLDGWLCHDRNSGRCRPFPLGWRLLIRANE